MTRYIMPSFGRFKEEAIIIGRLLAGYGELEFEWKVCLGEALGDKTGRELRVLFRVRSESGRIEVGDALMRNYYHGLGVGEKYNIALGAMRYCKTIRNKFSHCHWLDFPEAGLFFTNLEDSAASKEGDLMLKFHHVDVPLLNKHEEYFCYAMDCLLHLHNESKKLRGELKENHFSWPKVLQKPALHNPSEKHPLPERLTEGSS